MNIIFTKKSEEDLQNITIYISQDNKETGGLVIDKVWNTCELLASLPSMGVPVNNIIDIGETDKDLLEIIHSQKLLENMRKFPVEKFRNLLIFYTVKDEQLHIERVLHAHRDIPNIFSAIN